MNQKALECEEEIRRLLGSENEKLFIEHDKCVGRRMAISDRHAYKQGLADGIRLCVGIGLISK